MHEKTIKLKEPFEFAGETISELRLQKPKAKHLRSLPAKPNTGDILNMAAKLANITPAMIDELGIEDVMQVVEAINDFLPGGLRTGKQE